MCVCLDACLYRCMYMSRTHNTCTHVNTINTSHNNEFSTRLFSHQISFKDGPKHPNYSDESAPRSWTPTPSALLSCALYSCVCVHVCIRVLICFVSCGWFVICCQEWGCAQLLVGKLGHTGQVPFVDELGTVCGEVPLEYGFEVLD